MEITIFFFNQEFEEKPELPLKAQLILSLIEIFGGGFQLQGWRFPQVPRRSYQRRFPQLRRRTEMEKHGAHFFVVRAVLIFVSG